MHCECLVYLWKKALHNAIELPNNDLDESGLKMEQLV